MACTRYVLVEVVCARAMPGMIGMTDYPLMYCLAFRDYDYVNTMDTIREDQFNMCVYLCIHVHCYTIYYGNPATATVCAQRCESKS